ncbi:hypothetical protein Taro_030867 [Colocasia esculenta]|uniref:Uncharacterized protein n=1 Tax=Colocasia esculenta TaxID=4460 RepID=A0A843VNH3_COLES|nr:hypothetical protein [Colocasia esculenta]
MHAQESSIIENKPGYPDAHQSLARRACAGAPRASTRRPRAGAHVSTRRTRPPGAPPPVSGSPPFILPKGSARFFNLPLSVFYSHPPPPLLALPDRRRRPLSLLVLVLVPLLPSAAASSLIQARRTPQAGEHAGGAEGSIVHRNRSPLCPFLLRISFPSVFRKPPEKTCLFFPLKKRRDFRLANRRNA